MPAKPAPDRRADYVRFTHIPTRWMDNDVYRHVNDVVYYSFFDTAVNRMLIDEGVLDIETSTVVGLVVETGCRYFADRLSRRGACRHAGRASRPVPACATRSGYPATTPMWRPRRGVSCMSMSIAPATADPLPERLRALLLTLRRPAP